jgi:hypothetical protein
MNHYSYGLACFIAKLGWASVFIYLWIMALGWHIPFMIFTAITIISSIVVFFGKQDINV